MKNIENLFFAGRNISVTHSALSATRVMATCALVGQAVGIAAAIAVRDGLTPREIYEKCIPELQQTLMEDDCYLPWNKREIPELTRKAELTASAGDPEPIRNGMDRPVGEVDNGWMGTVGDSWIEYNFGKLEKISKMRFVFDSNLNREEKNMPCNYPLKDHLKKVPGTIIRKFRIDAMKKDGQWENVICIDNNYQRLLKIELDATTSAVRFIPEETWGSETAHLFAWDIR